jgi:hypothetical protein
MFDYELTVTLEAGGDDGLSISRKTRSGDVHVGARRS